MQYKLAPSMMCANIFTLRETLATFEKSEIDLLHLDIMDGAFVPNFALGVDDVRQLKEATRIPLDLHFMVEHPERHLAAFAFGEGDMVSLHWESTPHIQRALQAVKDRGAKCFLAINPGTPVEMARDLLATIDGLLVMTVNPGFAGQKLTPGAMEKIQRARAFLDENGRPDAEIQVDGNVSIPNAIRMKEAGANIFVAGTSALFRGDSLEENIRTFRKEVFES